HAHELHARQKIGQIVCYHFGEKVGRASRLAKSPQRKNKDRNDCLVLRSRRCAGRRQRWSRRGPRVRSGPERDPKPLRQTLSSRSPGGAEKPLDQLLVRQLRQRSLRVLAPPPRGL